MATLRPEMFSIEELLDFYEAAEGNDYMIYMGTKPTADYCRYSFVGDKEIGRQKLLTDLTQLRNNPENYNTYLMQVISENGTGRGRAKKEPVLTSIIFQLNRPVQYSGYQQQMGSVGSARTEMLLERLVEQNSLLQSRLAALEAIGELEEEEEIPEKKEKIIPEIMVLKSEIKNDVKRIHNTSFKTKPKPMNRYSVKNRG